MTNARAPCLSTAGSGTGPPARQAAELRPASGLAGEAVQREAAGQRWIEEHGEILWKFAMARTRSREVAEEVVQETLLAALQGYGSFAQKSAERTWLLAIAAHKIADHFRRTRRSRGAVGAQGCPAGGCGCGGCEGGFTPAGRWEAIAPAWPGLGSSGEERREQAQALAECIDALPAGQGEAFWLRDVLGIPAAEVCRTLGLTETNLWSRMHRARAALRACLGAVFAGWEEKKQ
jgi:RNA polymerase sigma-70 factor, ECF subfamily